MTTPLDPVIAQIIPLLPPLDADTATPQNVREGLRAIAAGAKAPPPQVESITDISIQGAVDRIPARVYRLSGDRSPTVVFFHGGGWVAGDLETHDRQARRLAIETCAVVISVDYRRAPETRFPGAVEDCFAAVQDVLLRIAEFGGDNLRVGVAGDSAGGNLAAVVAIACRDAGIKLAAQLLIYPATDLAGNFADGKENVHFPSRIENEKGYWLSRAITEWFVGQYLGDSKHGLDWRASPLRAERFAGLAPAVIGTAWFDPARDEGQAYADALEKAGVATKRHHGAGLIHGYFGMVAVSEAARLEVQRVCADFRALLNRGD